MSRWTAEDGIALLGRGFTNDAIGAALADLEQIETDYPAWDMSVTPDGWFRASYAATRNGQPPAYDADTPGQLRQKIARHYAQAIRPAGYRPEGNTL